MATGLRSWANEWMVVVFTKMKVYTFGGGRGREWKIVTFVNSMNVKEPEKLNTSFWEPLTTPFFRAQAPSLLAKTSSLLSQVQIPCKEKKGKALFWFTKGPQQRWVSIRLCTRVRWVTNFHRWPPTCTPFFTWRRILSLLSFRLGWLHQLWAMECDGSDLPSLLSLKRTGDFYFLPIKTSCHAGRSPTHPKRTHRG